MLRRLHKNCGPLTVEQRVPDWFNTKVCHVTGTMAKHLMACTDDFGEPATLLQFLQKFVDSWFERHKGTEAMRQGSANEIPAGEKAASCDWIEALHETGILELMAHCRKQFGLHCH